MRIGRSRSFACCFFCSLRRFFLNRDKLGGLPMEKKHLLYVAVPGIRNYCGIWAAVGILVYDHWPPDTNSSNGFRRGDVPPGPGAREREGHSR